MGRADQAACVDRGDLQLDVPDGMVLPPVGFRNCCQQLVGDAFSIGPFRLQAGEQLLSLLLSCGIPLLLVKAVREHRQQPARRPLYRRALPQDQYLPVGQVLHEVPERRPVGPSSCDCRWR